MAYIQAAIKGGKAFITVSRVRGIYRREGIRGVARRIPWWVWALVTAAVAAIGMMFVTIFMVMAMAMTAATAVTNVVDRLPGGTWLAENVFRRLDLPGLTAPTQDEADEITQMLDEHPEITHCLAAAPPVEGEAVTLFIATEDEKRDIIAYQNERRTQSRGRDTASRDRTRNIAAERGAVSASAGIDPDLISTQPAVVPTGQQIMDGDKAVNSVNDLINQVPPGTDVGTAQTFLLVSYAGGVVNWRHFATVLAEAGIESVHTSQTFDIAEQFFEPGIDFAPYFTAVNASLISLSIDGIIDGSVAEASRAFSHCSTEEQRAQVAEIQRQQFAARDQRQAHQTPPPPAPDAPNSAPGGDEAVTIPGG